MNSCTGPDLYKMKWFIMFPFNGLFMKFIDICSSTTSMSIICGFFFIVLVWLCFMSILQEFFTHIKTSLWSFILFVIFTFHYLQDPNIEAKEQGVITIEIFQNISKIGEVKPLHYEVVATCTAKIAYLVIVLYYDMHMNDSWNFPKFFKVYYFFML